MESFRFIHAADLHLDSPFKGLSYLPRPIRSRMLNSTFDAFRKLIDIAIENNVDFVLFAGDIYDTHDRSLRAQLRFLQGTEQLASHGIHSYIVHGNHDAESGRKASLNWPKEVHFFPSDQVMRLEAVNREGKRVCDIYGMSYAHAAVHENLALRFRLHSKDRLPGVRIGLLHANVEGQGEHDNYAPCTLEDLTGAGMDYWALGHIHKRQLIHQYPFVVYPGNVQGRSIKEQDAKGCYLVDVSESGEFNVQFRETDVVRWIERYVTIEGLNTWDELRSCIVTLTAKLQEDVQQSVMLRLRLTGRGDLHNELRKEGSTKELLEELRSLFGMNTEERGAEDAVPFVWIESIKLDTAAELDVEALMNEDHFFGDLMRSVAELELNTARLQAFSESALGPLWQHTSALKWLETIDEEKQKQWLKQAQRLTLDLLMDETEKT
jgi:exonuclease SbcD